MNILIIDDAEMIRLSLLKLLGGIKGINKIYEADSVRFGIEMIQSVHPDFIILDLNFPEGSGFDVLNYLKTIENPPTVIVLTNYNTDQYKHKAIELGAKYFFDKTIEFDKIIDVLEENSTLASY